MNKSRLCLIIMLMLLLAACQPTAKPIPSVPAQGVKEPVAAPTQEMPAVPQTPEIRTDYAPDAKDATMTRGKFMIKTANLAPVEGKAGFFTVAAEGSLPTPCNLPRVVVSPPDTGKKIAIEAYSVIDPNKMCTQVIKPFSGKLAEMGGYPSGTYSVVVNGSAIGEITVP